MEKIRLFYQPKAKKGDGGDEVDRHGFPPWRQRDFDTWEKTDRFLVKYMDRIGRYAFLKVDAADENSGALIVPPANAVIGKTGNGKD